MPDEKEFVPRTHLVDKYEVVIENQTSSIQNFDNKIWRTMRLNGIVIGTGIGGLSLVFGNSNSLSDVFIPSIAFAISAGIIAMIVSLAFAIRSYRSAVFAFGPTKEIGSKISESEPDTDDYKETMVESYVDAIENNSSALSKKEKGFRKSLSALLFGISNYSLGIFLIVWNVSRNQSIAILCIGILVSAISSYLAVYRKPTANKMNNKPDEGEKDSPESGQKKPLTAR